MKQTPLQNRVQGTMKSKIVYSLSSLLELKTNDKINLEIPYQHDKQPDYVPTKNPRRFIPIGSIIIKIVPGLPIPRGAVPLPPYFKPNWQDMRPMFPPRFQHPPHTCADVSLSDSSDYSIQIQLPPVN